MKMYIVIRDDLGPGMSALAAAHAALRTYLTFERLPETVKWIAGTFSKVVCQADEAEFEAAKAFGPHALITEARLGGREVAIGFPPVEGDEPLAKRLKYLRLYKGESPCWTEGLGSNAESEGT